MNIFEIRKNFANNIIALRTAKDLTQTQFAEQINYTDKAVSKWERGESIPDISGLSVIADFFNVTIDWLISRHSPEEVPDKISEEEEKHRKNHLWISILAVIGVLFVATVAFIVLYMLKVAHPWVAYLWVIPLGMIVMLIFNAIWGKYDHNFIFISLIVWFVILSFYLTFSVFSGRWNLWPIILLIIPLQAAVIFWYKIR